MKRSIKETLFRIIILFIGLTIAHLGVTLFLLSDLGADPFNVLVQGIFRTLSELVSWPFLTHGNTHVTICFLIIIALFGYNYLSENYSPEVAASRAPIVMYMALCLLTDTQFERVEDYRDYINSNLEQDKLKPLKYLKKANPEAYTYVVKVDRLMAENDVIPTT